MVMSVIKLALTSLILVAISLTVGLYCKSTFTDMGIRTMRTVEQAEKMMSTIPLLYDDGMMETIAPELTTGEWDQIPVIVVVKPSGKMRQYDMLNQQEAKVITSVKGGIRKGEIILICDEGGFMAREYSGEPVKNGVPVYNEMMGLMKPDDEYLVFLTPNPLNALRGKDQKLYFLESRFGIKHLNLTRDYSVPVTKANGVYVLADFKGSEFFSTKQVHLDKLYSLKRQLIKKYLGDAR
jgi:hypothetical protein